MNIQGFNHATIRVSDLERSLSFYCGVLGMNLVHRGRKDVYLEWGSAWVCLIEQAGARRAEPDACCVDHLAFSIATDDFDKAVGRLRSCGVPIVRGPLLRGGGYSVNFLDPDGTELECFTGTLAERMKEWA